VPRFVRALKIRPILWLTQNLQSSNSAVDTDDTGNSVIIGGWRKYLSSR